MMAHSRLFRHLQRNQLASDLAAMTPPTKPEDIVRLKGLVVAVVGMYRAAQTALGLNGAQTGATAFVHQQQSRDELIASLGMFEPAVLLVYARFTVEQVLAIEQRRVPTT